MSGKSPEHLFSQETITTTNSRANTSSNSQSAGAIASSSVHLFNAFNY
jgi:hypothetical protein